MTTPETHPDPLLVVTLGDPAGIGPEVTARAVERFRREGHATSIVAIGSAAALEAAQRLLPDEPAVALPLRDPEPGGIHSAGRPGPATGRAALQALAMALRLTGERLRAGLPTALVTAPVAKAELVAAGARFVDHTTLLGAVCAREPIMSFVGGGFRVALATVHVPLMAVAGQLTVDGLARLIVRTGRAFGRRDRLPSPVEVAVCGLNPHAGEGGLMGDEDDRIIRPAVELATELADSGWADEPDVAPSGFVDVGDGIEPVPVIAAADTSATTPPALRVSGPWPADTVFHRARRGDFDVVIAMYHDQGLIPVKTLAFHEAVNATLNLPFVRTSPDHGTAFDIAGRGIADPGSMTAALRLAARWLVW